MTYMFLLIVYLVFVAIFFLLVFVNVYHILRFSMFRVTSAVVILIFFVISMTIIVGTFAALRDINWSHKITIELPSINTSLDINGSQ